MPLVAECRQEWAKMGGVWSLGVTEEGIYLAWHHNPILAKQLHVCIKSP